MRRLLLLLIAATAAGFSVSAQQLTLNLTLSPPYSPYLSDYLSFGNKALLSITNTGGAVDVFFRGSITGDNGVSGSTKTDFRPGAPNTINAGPAPTLLRGPDFEAYFNFSNFNITGITTRELFSGAGLPEGNYTICLQAFDFATGRPVSNDACFVLRIVYPEPPVPMMPLCESTALPNRAQQLTFTWSPSPGAPPRTRYVLKVVELWPGQVPYDAINTITTPPFFEKEVSIPTYTYRLSDPVLTVGKRYAWAVTAFDPTNATLFRNNGRSPVCTFTYGTTDTVRYNQSNTASIPTRGDIKFIPDPKPAVLAGYAFKGKLEWGFGKTGISSTVQPNNSFNGAVASTGMGTWSGAAGPAGVGSYNGGPGTGAGPAQGSGGGTSGGTGTTTGSTTSTSGPGYNTYGWGATTAYAPGLSPAVSSAVGAGGGGISGNATAAFNAAMEAEKRKALMAALAPERHPLAGIPVKLTLRMNPTLQAQLQQMNQYQNPLGSVLGNNTPPGFTPEVFLGMAVTNAAGEFSLQHFTPVGLGQELVIEPVTEHFYYLPIVVPVSSQAYGTYDVGTHTGMAITYRVAVKVQDSAGNALKTASVKIARGAFFYASKPEHASLRPEFGGKQKLKQGGMSLTGSGAPYQQDFQILDSGGHGDVFFHAFFNETVAEKYTVFLQADGAVSRSADLLVDTKSAPSTLVDIYSGEYGPGPLITKTYTLKLALPRVSGRIVSDPGDVALRSAKVVVHPADMDAKAALTAKKAFHDLTDSAGRFSVAGIALSGKPYRITVMYVGKSYPQTENLLLSKRGILINRDPIKVEAVTIPVCGTVVNAAGERIKGAAVQWKTGGATVTTDGDGVFYTAQTAGKHTLVIRKPGYRDEERDIVVASDKGAKTKLEVGTPEEMWEKYQNTPPFSNSGGSSSSSSSSSGGTSNGGSSSGSGSSSSGGTTTTLGNAYGTNYNLASAGYTASNSLLAGRSFYDDIFSGAGLIGYSKSLACGGTTITLRRFYVQVTVKNAVSGAPVKGAGVRVDDGKSPAVLTSTTGVALLSDVTSGAANLTVEAPANTDYATALASVSISTKSDTSKATVSLKMGTSMSGTVFTDGTGAKGAEVYVVGKDYIRTLAASNGTYTLRGIPEGEYTVRAAKSGYLAAEKTSTFAAGKPQTADFTLTSPGFKADKILGFPMVLTASKAGAAPGEFIISGKLTDLPSNVAFKAAGAAPVLAFTDKVVVKKASGAIEPKGGSMALDAPEMSVKIFDFAMGTAKGKGGGLKLRTMSGTTDRGEIAGTLALDLAGTFSALSGWTMPTGGLDLTSGSTDELPFLTSDGSAPLSSYTVKGGGGWKVYGISFAPAKDAITISKSGIQLAGSISSPSLPQIGSITLKVDKMKISTSGELTALDITVNPKPKLSLAPWGLTISAAALDQYGLKLGGDLKVPLPQSGDASLAVSNLVLNSSGISGATVKLPTDGISLLGVATFKTPEPLSFTTGAGGSGYGLSATNGTVKLPSYISKDISLKKFMVSTSGEFDVLTETGFTTDFAGLASLTVNSLGFSSAGTVDLAGNIKLAIPMCGISAGAGIHYSKNSVKVDSVALGFDIGSTLAADLMLGFANSGFHGRGGLSIGDITGIKLAFQYGKAGGGTQVGAQFTLPSAVAIPIGPIKWNNITGGFLFNTAEDRYKVNAGGRLSFIADAADLVSIDKVNVAITAMPGGPVFEGSGTGVIKGGWKLGDASFVLDVPQRFFNISAKIGSGFELVKGVSIDNTQQVTVEADADDPYLFFSYNSNISIPFLANSSALVAGGWNVLKSQSPSLGGIPDFVLTNGRLYGGYVRVASSIGLSEANAPWIGFKGVAAVKAWYHNASDAEVYANLKSGKYGLRIGQGWSNGAKADLFGFSVVSAAIAVDGALEAAYAGGNWNMAGKLSGSVSAHVGCDGGCNGITWGGCFNACLVGCRICPVPCGLKICAGAGVNVGYSSISGPSFSLDLF